MNLRLGALLITLLVSTAGAFEPVPIVRRIPPQGIALDANVKAGLQEQLASLERRFEEIDSDNHRADVAVYLKAVRLALYNGEFYRRKDVELAKKLLNQASNRMDAMGHALWGTATGLVVRGFISEIDDSSQPYGLVIPDDHDFAKPSPLYVWLHGRGDKKTDMHFITERQAKAGQISPAGAIVLHPFGRHCIGFKSAGEMDVLEAIDATCRNYKIDKQRIVLMGFSMGGAGCWHVGAHFTDRFVGIAPGAGFAETAEYNRLTPESYPPEYEQRLWGTYDVPGYTRNLFNVPVVAYSGENDKQIQAARIMESAYENESRSLTHVIGPGMGHKYHPDSLEEILAAMQAAVEGGQTVGQRRSVSLQTRTLRYHKMGWVEALRLTKHWEDSRVDAEWVSDDSLKVATKNVERVRLSPGEVEQVASIEIDGQSLGIKSRSDEIVLNRLSGRWQVMDSAEANLQDDGGLSKSPGLQGPIDDAFMSRFLVVLPTRKSRQSNVNQWVESEVSHLKDRWRALFRGELPVKLDTEVTAQDLRNSNLVLFGDFESNRIIKGLVGKLPLDWDAMTLTLAGKSYDSTNHMPVMIYPNPLSPSKYVVLNSGPTFRESHDRTNSLQNPKLPDWAVLDIRVAPNGEAAGAVVHADFFDESWNVR